MSIAALNWAWSQDCPSAPAKLILLALADKANEEGECWPGMDTVAAMAGLSMRQVSTHLGKIEQAGLIVRKRRRSTLGRLGRNVYHLNIASGSSFPVDQRKSTSGSTEQVDQADHRKSDVVTTGSLTSSATGSLLPHKEHPSKSNHQRTISDGFPVSAENGTPLASRIADWLIKADHHPPESDQLVDHYRWAADALERQTEPGPRKLAARCTLAHEFVEQATGEDLQPSAAKQLNHLVRTTQHVSSVIRWLNEAVQRGAGLDPEHTSPRALVRYAVAVQRGERGAA